MRYADLANSNFVTVQECKLLVKHVLVKTDLRFLNFVIRFICFSDDFVQSVCFVGNPIFTPKN